MLGSCCADFSLAAVSRGCSLVAARASPCSGFPRCAVGAAGRAGAAVFGSRRYRLPSRARHRGLAAPRHYGLFPGQGSNPRILRWPMDSLPLIHEGSPAFVFLKKPSLRIFPKTGFKATDYDSVLRYSICNMRYYIYVLQRKEL